MSLKMAKPDQYYYTDSIFQLELNLQDIRRELTLMVAEFEKEECFTCLKLKCRCSINSFAQDRNVTDKSSRGNSDNKSKNVTKDTAPGDLLSKSKAKFVRETTDGLIASNTTNSGIDAWIAASRTVHNPKIGGRIPTDIFLFEKASLKNHRVGRGDVVKEKIQRDFIKDTTLDTRFSAGNAVDMFFNRFKVQPSAAAGNIAYIANVAASYGSNRCRGPEYSYF